MSRFIRVLLCTFLLSTFAGCSRMPLLYPIPKDSADFRELTEEEYRGLNPPNLYGRVRVFTWK